jgi:hypothetical protein
LLSPSRPRNFGESDSNERSGDSPGGFDPALGCKDKAVEARLFSNPIEFDGIAVAQPVLNDPVIMPPPAKRLILPRAEEVSGSADAAQAGNCRP